MNENPAPAKTKTREYLRSRFNSLTLSRQQGVLGPAEIVALVGSLLILFLVLVAYFYFLMPARSRLSSAQLERSRLQAQLRNSEEVVKKGESTEATVQTITQSLDDFETNQLASSDRGRMNLYDSLNQLIRKQGLRNTSGPTYLPLESTAVKGSGSSRAANAKWQSVYPGIAISVTVEGPYQNLRRFVQELEATKQFIIINSVELERATDTNSLPAIDASGAPATGRPALVSLRLDMATYFQRSGIDAATPQTVND